MRRAFKVLVVVIALGAAACGDDDSGEASDTTSAPEKEPTYSTLAFSVPFDVTVPAELPAEPTIDETNFVTWESRTPDGPAVRFLAPVSVFPPGSTIATPPPEDYLAYLLAQEGHGATFTDQTETVVGDLPTTMITATVDEALDGSLGCPELEMDAGDCFGLQPELTLRVAVMDVDGRTLLAWLRHNDSAGDPADLFAAFEGMLASLTFREDGPSTTVASAAASPVDGVWVTTITEAALESSPLLYEPGEVNDENWGDLTFTFERGRFTVEQQNVRETSSYSGTFDVAGDVLSITMEGVEHFEMRWHVEGDELTLTRDDALGISPTPWVMQPWTRMS